jgi:protein-S-isoprenylcysteine O-methyltransferase Ste14
MEELIRNPPSWIIAIIIALLTAHGIDKLIEVVTRRRNHNGLIPLLELFIVFVLSFLALHSYYEGMFKSEIHNWYDRPFAVVVALVIFGLGSIALYVVSRSLQTVKGSRKGTAKRVTTK